MLDKFLKKIKKPRHYRMWNGVDLELYSASFPQCCKHAVLQHLELFQWDRSAEKAYRYLLLIKNKEGYTVKSEVTQKPKKEKVYWDEPTELTTVVGICPKCGWALLGDPIYEKCERSESDRLFVTVCSNCTYYKELFEREQGQLEEVEGD